MSPNVTTEANSKRGNNEEIIGSNATYLIKENKTHYIKESFDFVLNDEDEIKTQRNRKPLTFENNSNDISFLNNKEKVIKEENINDSDDEGTINETNDYDNFFKGVEIYQNKYAMNNYSEPNIYEYSKHYKNKKIF